MSEKYSYHYDSDTRILSRSHYGNFTLQDIFDSWNDAIDNDLIPKRTIGFFIDYRDADLQVDPSDHKKIIEYFDSRKEIFGDKKFAVLVNSPRNTVLPFIIEHTPKHYTLKTFTTEEAALRWILNDRL
ncbi:hypothetical protein MQE36_01710 [Zhouia spongiae]|uniref:STAS/SEC14 domain-containing protein n=1 Tax=Zhouia spongiae TaxID=2202721 RepID=A0ABY3YML9_9FLAO|nr:hypothetical protein [Zhouia spongiae]UNY99076.1 hypothetical protein MQE36_01710 [Zhouia spongiae]